jgi:choline dehydrogenase-like flavoprotein
MSFTYVLRDARGRVGMGHGFGITVIGLKPDSRGNVKLVSADPAAAPRIDLRMFSVPGDLEVLVRGIKIARQILESPAFERHRDVEVDPGRHVKNEANLIDYVRKTAFVIYHPVGTCKMGTDPAAVVGADLRVRGLDGIRVADASIMPTIVRGNTNAPAIMIGEKAADMILGKAPLAPVKIDRLERFEASLGRC